MCVQRCYNKFVILYGNLKTQICKYYTVDLFILCVGGKAKKSWAHKRALEKLGKLSLQMLQRKEVFSLFLLEGRGWG